MNERVKQIMSDILGIDPKMIDHGTCMQTVAGWDSLNHINLCVSLEAEFGLSLSVSDMEAMASYAGILDVLDAQRGDLSLQT